MPSICLQHGFTAASVPAKIHFLRLLLMTMANSQAWEAPTIATVSGRKERFIASIDNLECAVIPTCPSMQLLSSGRHISWLSH
ncbi:hypothetical protein ABIB82_007614 [Bradyrhizobium sp. i1.8.4]